VTQKFYKGDFLLEYRGKVTDVEDDLPAIETYVYQFCYKSKSMW